MMQALGRVIWINGAFGVGKTTVAELLLVPPALADARFAQHIETETTTAAGVVEKILRRIAA